MYACKTLVYSFALSFSISVRSFAVKLFAIFTFYLKMKKDINISIRFVEYEIHRFMKSSYCHIFFLVIEKNITLRYNYITSYQVKHWITHISLSISFYPLPLYQAQTILPLLSAIALWVIARPRNKTGISRNCTPHHHHHVRKIKGKMETSRSDICVYSTLLRP